MRQFKLKVAAKMDKQHVKLTAVVLDIKSFELKASATDT